MRGTLSTAAVAKMLGVAVGSVSKWIDMGRLRAGRTPGGHRRITKADLRQFLDRQQLPVPPELAASSRVLIVDDDEAVAQWLCQEVRERLPETEVLVATDGFSAGEIVASAKPGVVILDLRMPGMDGFEVCRRIKQRPETQSTTIIAITAYPSDEARSRIMEAGAESFYVKPVDAGVMAGKVRAALAAR